MSVCQALAVMYAARVLAHMHTRLVGSATHFFIPRTLRHMHGAVPIARSHMQYIPTSSRVCASR